MAFVHKTNDIHTQRSCIHKAQLENIKPTYHWFSILYLSVYRPENPRKFLQFKLFFTYKWKFNIIMRLYSFQLSLFQIHGTFSVLYIRLLVQNFICGKQNLFKYEGRENYIGSIFCKGIGLCLSLVYIVAEYLVVFSVGYYSNLEDMRLVVGSEENRVFRRNGNKNELFLDYFFT